MRNPDRCEVRRTGGSVEIARECMAGDCDVLVWPDENDRHLCPEHYKMFQAGVWAHEIADELLHVHCMLTNRIFNSYEQRDRYRDEVLIPKLIKGGKGNLPQWDVRLLLALTQGGKRK